ncbi:MAG: hypothetical protein EAZ15_05755 [Sphingobacteriales bacterium]|nr:MAG: hypothetical protein EAZ15_05755 [Sphingobacteriales bacterium]
MSWRSNEIRVDKFINLLYLKIIFWAFIHAFGYIFFSIPLAKAEGLLKIKDAASIVNARNS